MMIDERLLCATYYCFSGLRYDGYNLFECVCVCTIMMMMIRCSTLQVDDDDETYAVSVLPFELIHLLFLSTNIYLLTYKKTI